MGCGTVLFYTTFFYGYSFSWSSSTGPCCFTQIPLASSEVEGRWQWPSLDCHSFYGTACAFGLTWRPLTGSLFLSSFWCRLKPGPSGERGRKSGLLQDMLVTGLGPTSERVDGRVQAWTRLALDSFKGSNPVWRATGHNEPVDGRVQTWTRHGSDQHSASEHRQNVHRNVCETIGHFQPTRMGDRFFLAVFQRGIQVVDFTAVRSGIVSLSFLLS